MMAMRFGAGAPGGAPAPTGLSSVALKVALRNARAELSTQGLSQDVLMAFSWEGGFARRLQASCEEGRCEGLPYGLPGIPITATLLI